MVNAKMHAMAINIYHNKMWLKRVKRATIFPHSPRATSINIALIYDFDFLVYASKLGRVYAFIGTV